MKLLLFLIVILSIFISGNSGTFIENKYNLPIQEYSEAHRYYNYSNSFYDFRKPIGYLKIYNPHELVDALCYAKSIGKGVSIRAGGHSGASLNVLNDTLNLDLSGLKGISVDRHGKTATIQAGVLLGEYYQELFKYGLGSTGGTCAGVGLGLALGGGTGYFGSQKGYMVDNIIEHTVLLSNGEIIKANPFNKYSDIHWALKGAGHGGFGIVIDYKVKVFNLQSTYYHNQLTVPFKDYSKAVLVLNSFVESLSEHDQSITHYNILTVVKKDIESSTVLLNFFYMKGPSYQGDFYFKNLLTLMQMEVPSAKPVAGNINDKTFLELMPLMPYDDYTEPIRSFQKGRFSLLNNETVSTAFELLNTFNDGLNHVLNDNRTSCTSELHYHGGMAIYGDLNEYREKNAFIHRGEDNKWVISFSCYYYNSDNDDLFTSLKKVTNSKINIFSKRLYNNFPDDDIDFWQTGLYGDYYPRLQQIKKKYDPKNFFNFPQSIELP